MTKKTKLLAATLLTIGLSNIALAQTNTNGNTPLPTSVTNDCASFLKAIANVPNFNGMTAQQQNSTVLAAATPYTNSLKACFQNNACQQAPLSSQPNCSQYLSLWNLLNTTPSTVAPAGGTQSPTPTHTMGATPPPPSKSTPTNNMDATPPASTNNPGNNTTGPNSKNGSSTQQTPENNGKQQKEQINWF